MIWSFRIFIKFLCWILTVSNPQPKVLWHVSDNLMILIRKAKLFNFLCNISAIPFTDLKVFNPGATLAIITSIYVTSKGKFFNQYIYARHKENASTHWKDFLSLEATCHYLCWWNNKKLHKTDTGYCILTFHSYWKHRTTGKSSSPQGVFPRGWRPFPPILLLLRTVLLLTKELFWTSQCNNSKTSIHLYILDLHTMCWKGKVILWWNNLNYLIHIWRTAAISTLLPYHSSYSENWWLSHIISS